MIRYLSQEEKKDTIPLWKEAFPEDSDAFLEYYYREKAKDNRILAVVEKPGGPWVSMLHRNPYKIQVNHGLWEIDYIVAVATAKSRRRQGLMKSLLIRMMGDMYQEGREFCFLMPADPKIYEPFGFAYIYDQPHWKLTQEAETALRKDTDVGGAACWMNRWLEERYRVFAKRSPAYVERLIKELESEGGWMEVLAPDGLSKQAAGIRCWWGVEKKEQRMLLADESYMEKEKPDTPAIMARIIHLENFLKAVCLKKEGNVGNGPLTVRLEVKDGICRGNEGTFLWTIREDGSGLCPWEGGMKAEEALKAEIPQLTRYLFGYEKGPGQTAPWMERIQGLNPVFLDEVV